MLDFAYGELELKPDDFWRLTWGEYHRMVRGYNRRIKARQYELASLLAAVYNTIPRKKGSKQFEPDDFIPKQRKGDDLSPEERQELAKKALENSKRFEKGVVKSNM